MLRRTLALASLLAIPTFASDRAMASYYGVRSDLVATDAIQATDDAGTSVALDGDTAIVGAPKTAAGATVEAGAARVFVRSGATWTQQGKLVASAPRVGAWLGQSVALSGDVALIGAPLDGEKAAGAGAAIAFVRTGTTWTQEAKLFAKDPAAGAVFGYAVALEGNTALVGAYQADVSGTARVGAVYVLLRSGTTWTEQAKLVPPAGDADDLFGWQVALSGDTALISAAKDDDKGTDAGAAYVYVRSGTTWSLQAKLLAGDGAANDQLGIAVALHKDTAVLGARNQDAKGADAGAAYVFLRSGTSWSQQAKLTSSIGGAGDKLGSSVAVDGDSALVGAPFADPNGADCGAAAFYTRVGATWTEQAQLFVGPEVAAGMRLGTGVSLRGATALVGAPAAAGIGKSSAFSFALARQKTNGEACACPLGSKNCPLAQCESGRCIDDVCCGTSCDGPCRACSAALKGSGADGVCEPIAADTDPRNLCAASGMACAADGFCDGKGACRAFAKASTSCGVTTCASGTVTGNLCNGAGTCTPSTSPCGEYACNSTGSACNAKCTSDLECASDSFCTTTGACAKKKGNGTPCAAARECGTGRCVDGVCCNEACTGQCEACAIKGSEGTCTATTGAPAFGRGPCGGDGTLCAGACNGVNRASCVYAQSTETCGSSCASGKELRRACDGKGACVEATSKLCGAFACDPVAGRCRESCGVDDECNDGYRCDGGKCAPRVTASCSDDLRTSTRVDGTDDCGRFLCERTSGLCRKACTESAQCAPGHVCDLAAKDCVAAAAEGDDGGCGVGRGRGSIAAFLVLSLALVGARRRRAR